MKGVQYYELFGGIALKNHTFFIFKDVRKFIIENKSKTVLLLSQFKSVNNNKGYI